MKNLIVSAVFALASFVAVAQTTPGTMPAPGTTPTTQPQTSPSQTSDMPGAGSQAPSNDKRSEKSLKGCIVSTGGQYALEDKHGKQTALAGSSDFAAHVGHTVAVHGSFANGSDSSAASSNSGAGSGDQFMVSKIDMVSDKCNATKSKNKDMNSDPTAKPSPNRN